ncbi:MAG: M23 family metallopeptidase [Geminicoccaceae bacterium]|nr:M23 family metallopeptidase [Geminicoccaceae bacterium]
MKRTALVLSVLAAPVLVAPVLAVTALPAAAQDGVSPPAAASDASPVLSLPIECELDRDCWLVRYLDHDPGPGVRDYRGGDLSGDGHSGTDIAVADYARIARGVPVLAAAAGVVAGARDGMTDGQLIQGDAAGIRGSECGNGVLLEHADGWQTQYCHMRRGSVLVQEGQKVDRGDRLGLVGMSGETSYPHLHFSVRRDGRDVDPFTGIEDGGAPLWAASVGAADVYAPVVVTAAGVAGEKPDWDLVQAGRYTSGQIPATAEALVVWLRGYWLEPGDVIRYSVVGSDGTPIFESVATDEKGNRDFFRFSGTRPPEGGFEPGSYEARVTIERPAGTVIAERRFGITIAPEAAEASEGRRS